jgi:alkylation response protein AidB-like acyl-CoA dehydrogenase
MDLSFTPEENAFREEVRTFLRERLPLQLSERVRRGAPLSKADIEEWHAILHSRGWLANHWPEEFGGPGWSVVQRYIFEIEAALAHAPRILPFGLNMLGPVLIKFGTDAQKRHWLPRILDGTDWWCQGYSEPGAGSDLASLQTSAVRDGNHYIVNGQKTWTTLAQYADMMFCLVRTDPAAKKQEGISFLLIDMKSPGVVVRPIVLLDGEAEVNEVFFTDVRVPIENLVGGRRLLDDPLFAARVARAEIDLANMRTTNLRVLAAVAGGGAPGVESSMLKIKGTEIRQEISSLSRRAFGSAARTYLPDEYADGSNGQPADLEEAASASRSYFNNRKLSIFGGSNEVQKTIVAKTILEL